MSILKRPVITKIAVSLLIGVFLLFIPLLGDFHIESAMLASLVGCFWAGIRACNSSETEDFFVALRIGGTLFLVCLSLLINAIFTGCFSIDGLAFWLLFPLPSVFFGYAVGRLFRSWNVPYRRLLTVFVLITVGFGILIYELLNYPQVYFFNHVWGGWPGPIYDEAVRVSGSAVFFRSLTVLWAVLLWHIPLLNKEKYAKWIVGFAAVSILIGNTQLAEFGVTTPRIHLQHVLSGQKTTDHFELYYDQRLYSDYEIDLLAKEHEFYFKQIADQLELPPRDSADKIESYLYAHPWQKKELVGAKFTSYVPVWLQQDQLHIAKQQIATSLRHELVHILAKQFGNWYNASWSAGLIEGLAVAVDGGSSGTSTIDQLVVSQETYPTAQELEQMFSLWGFYSGRSGVNYTTSGSFVRYLMENHPIEPLKQAYATGRISEAYGVGWETMAEDWKQSLDTIETDTVDQQVASRVFGIPSLFEQKCPHVISDFAKAWDNYQFYLANRDTAEALTFLNQAVAKADSAIPAKTEWSYRHLVIGDPAKVRKAASLQDSTVDLQLLYADAFALSKNWEQANQHLKRAKNLFAENPDSLLKPAIETRNDKRQWQIYRQLTYHRKLPDAATFSEANHRTKVRALRQVIKREQWQRFEPFAKQMLNDRFQQLYFDDYLMIIHHLAFRDKTNLASRLIEKLSEMPLRVRYRERLQQEKDWIKFLQSRAR